MIHSPSWRLVCKSSPSIANGRRQHSVEWRDTHTMPPHESLAKPAKHSCPKCRRVSNRYTNTPHQALLHLPLHCIASNQAQAGSSAYRRPSPTIIPVRAESTLNAFSWSQSFCTTCPSPESCGTPSRARAAYHRLSTRATPAASDT